MALSIPVASPRDKTIMYLSALLDYELVENLNMGYAALMANCPSVNGNSQDFFLNTVQALGLYKVLQHYSPDAKAFPDREDVRQTAKKIREGMKMMAPYVKGEIGDKITGHYKEALRIVGIIESATAPSRKIRLTDVVKRVAKDLEIGTEIKGSIPRYNCNPSILEGVLYSIGYKANHLSGDTRPILGAGVSKEKTRFLGEGLLFEGEYARITLEGEGVRRAYKSVLFSSRMGFAVQLIEKIGGFFALDETDAPKVEILLRVDNNKK